MALPPGGEDAETGVETRIDPRLLRLIDKADHGIEAKIGDNRMMAAKTEVVKTALALAIEPVAMGAVETNQPDRLPFETQVEEDMAKEADKVVARIKTEPILASEDALRSTMAVRGLNRTLEVDGSSTAR